MDAILSLVAILILAFWTDVNELEVALLALAACVAVVRPRLWDLGFRRAEQWCRDFVQRGAPFYVAVGALTVLLRVAMLPFQEVPQPLIVDEFSHRLLAETLLLGRVSNPTPPMWEHLQTMQVIQRPAYASMYMPAQGFFLAIGKVLTGSLWAGVVLSVALMCMAICWALRGWLPPFWAALGGLIAILRFGLFSYWMNSYWGGAVSALGGALVIGAFPRLTRGARTGPAVLMGLGIALLLFSRPFEGAAVCAPVAVAIFAWLVRLRGRVRRVALLRAAAPVVCLVVLSAALLAWYDAKVTGSPFRLPYEVNQQEYGWPLTLAWFPVVPHSNTIRAMQDYFLWEVAEHKKVTDPASTVYANTMDAAMLWTFFAGPALTIYLIFVPLGFRDRRMRLPLAVLLAGLAALAIEQSRYPHYFSPATAAYLILLLEGARHMRAAGARGRPWLLAMYRFVPVVIVVVVAARAAVPALWHRRNWFIRDTSWCCSRSGNPHREKIVDALSRMPGKQLVIVRYGATHVFLYEWVLNGPDIDKEKIVWAHDMGSAKNEELIRYYSGRRVWLLNVDDDSKLPALSPY